MVADYESVGKPSGLSNQHGRDAQFDCGVDGVAINKF